MVVSNRNLLFQGSIFRGHVSFREGISLEDDRNPLNTLRLDTSPSVNLHIRRKFLPCDLLTLVIVLSFLWQTEVKQSLFWNVGMRLLFKESPSQKHLGKYTYINETSADSQKLLWRWKSSGEIHHRILNYYELPWILVRQSNVSPNVSSSFYLPRAWCMRFVETLQIKFLSDFVRAMQPFAH